MVGRSLILGFFVAIDACEDMEEHRRTIHTGNMQSIEPSELDKIETFKILPFISISFASVLNHPIHSHVNLSCPVSLAMKRVFFESVGARRINRNLVWTKFSVDF